MSRKREIKREKMQWPPTFLPAAKGSARTPLRPKLISGILIFMDHCIFCLLWSYLDVWPKSINLQNDFYQLGNNMSVDLISDMGRFYLQTNCFRSLFSYTGNALSCMQRLFIRNKMKLWFNCGTKTVIFRFRSIYFTLLNRLSLGSSPSDPPACTPHSPSVSPVCLSAASAPPSSCPPPSPALSSALLVDPPQRPAVIFSPFYTF